MRKNSYYEGVAVRRYREASRIETYRALHDILADYLVELDRDDNAHKARLFSRDDEVKLAVRLAHEAWENRHDQASDAETRKAMAWAEANPLPEN
jgi:hypothetical protein